MKKLAALLLWCTGSGLAIAVAWAGVAVVDQQIIDPAPAIAVAAPDKAQPPTSGPTTTSSTTPSALAPLTNSAAIQTTMPPVGDQETSAAPDSTAIPERTIATGPSLATETTVASEPSVTPGDESSAESSLPGSSIPAQPATSLPEPIEATTQTFELVGGTAAVSFSADAVVVLWATANAGFEVKIEPESPGVKVEFRSDGHRSRVDAWWSGGPQHTIREEER